MAASKFKGVIKRQIRLHSVPAVVITRITEDGIEMSVAGRKKKLSASWETIARNMGTPADSPSWLMGKPLEFLRHQAVGIKNTETGE